MNISHSHAPRVLHSLVRCVALVGAFWHGAGLAHAAGASAQSVQTAVNSDAFRASFVQTVYQKLLGRGAAPSEVPPLAAQLKSGGKAWQNVIVSVAGSPGYFAKSGSNNTTFVNKLFQDMVGRAPDATEETPASVEYLNGGNSRGDLAGVVADTEEFRGNWTQVLYKKLLGRAATSAELTAGEAKLNTGGIASLVSAVLSSPEFFQKSGGTQSTWQSAVNKRLLAPPAEMPDIPDAGMDTGATDTNGGFGTGTDMGTPTTPEFPMPTGGGIPMGGGLATNSTRAPMVQALLASPEYFANVVQSNYQKFLHRAATPAELQQATASMQGGSSSDQVVTSILTSDEYFNRAGGTTTAYLKRLSQDLLGKSGGILGKGNLPTTDDMVDMLRNLGRKKKP